MGFARFCACMRVLVCAALVLTTACGRSATEQTGQVPTNLAAVAFPDDKAASGLTEYIISGSSYEERSPGAVESGTTLVVSAGIGGFEYGLYRFNPGVSGAGALDSLSVLLEEGATSEAWIGVADFVAGSWDFSGPYTKVKTLALDDDKFISPAGNIWVAVMVPASHSATINALSVRAVNPANLAPSAALDSDLASGDAPLVVNFDASGSSDTDGQIVEYAWDFDGDNRYDGFSEDPQTSFTYTTPGLRTVKVRVTDDQFARSSATLNIDVNVAGNQPPLAAMWATPNSGIAPLVVTLNAGSSDDPDGLIVLYEWDFNGDGSWDSSGESATANHTYAAAGLFSARVRVTDDVGAQDIAMVDVDVDVNGNSGPVADLAADVTAGDAPLQVSFDATGSTDPDGPLVRYDWDFDGDGLWDAYDVGPQLGHTYLDGGDFEAKVRVTDSSGAQDAAIITINVNGLPVARLSKERAEGLITFDASASTDDGAIADIEWDLDGDDVFNEVGSEANAQGNALADFATPGTAGEYTAQVRVTDDDGATDSASLEYIVAGWFIVNVHNGSNLGFNSELIETDGRPAIVYGGSGLRYAISSDSEGRTGWTSDLLISSGLGDYSLAAINGHPAIAYKDTVNTDLVYLRSTTPDGADAADWTISQTVDSTGDVGAGASLAEINGVPAIAYRDTTNSDLKYALSTEADGSAGWTTVPVDADNATNVWGLEVIGGKPAISYHGNSVNKYAYSTTESGSSGWGSVTTGLGSVSIHSLANINGKPAVVYATGSGNLTAKYAYAFTADGSTGWEAVTIGQAISGSSPQISVCSLNGYPIAAVDALGNTLDLHFAYSTSVNGSGGWSSELMERGNTPQNPCIAVINGRAAISYRRSASGLYYAIRYEEE